MKSLIVLTLLLASASAWSAGTKKNLSQDIKFNNQLIQGRYQYSDEAMATVENEKYLDDLLGTRKNFKDRIKMSTKRY